MKKCALIGKVRLTTRVYGNYVFYNAHTSTDTQHTGTCSVHVRVHHMGTSCICMYPFMHLY